MSSSKSIISAAALTLCLGLSAWSQSPSAADPTTQALPALQAAPALPEAAVIPAVQMMQDFKDSDVKFDVTELVNILRDRRHEGWVLAAYPDPRTGQPLIGAGFSLDLPERQHPQTDPLNPHQFLEPSSADLWRAAGFDSERLDDILQVFYGRKRTWSKRTWRRQLYSLPAQISDDDAAQLVRVGAIQAVYNARAYCRSFDQLSGPQQMAMAQLVYQMGVNLQHFDAFLAMINSGDASASVPQVVAEDSAAFAPNPDEAPANGDRAPEYWQGVQKSLITSQWAHKYRTRAIAVIAMLDPAYKDDPSAAEQRVSAVLRPSPASRRHRHGVAAGRQVAAGTRAGHSARARNKRRRVTT